MPRGLHLISVKSGRNNGYLGGFWGNQQYQNRQGGDYLYEAVVFTNELTAAERADVTQYLLQKWGLQPAAGTAKGSVEVAPGTTLEIASDSGETLPKVAVSGGGTVVKKGTGAAEASFSDFAGYVARGRRVAARSGRGVGRRGPDRWLGRADRHVRTEGACAFHKFGGG